MYISTLYIYKIYDYIHKSTKYFQLINFSHSKSSEIAFSKLSWRIRFWKNDNSGNKRTFLIFGKKAHWIEDKGTCNFSPWVRHPDTLFPKIPPRYWHYLESLNKDHIFYLLTNFIKIENQWTCIFRRATWLGFWPHFTDFLAMKNRTSQSMAY